jgi:hypothetical protein
LEKEAIENAPTQFEEAERHRIQAEQDKTRKKQDQREEQVLQRRRENDHGM